MIDLANIAGFERDVGNARKNEKHGASAAEAAQAFFNQRVLVFAVEKHSASEARFQSTKRRRTPATYLISL